METIKQIHKLRKEQKLTIGFTCSCFDLFHTGHVLMLNDAKKQCDILVVGLQSDPTLDLNYRIKTNGKQKNKPIQSYGERYITISSCKYINYVVDYSTEENLEHLLKLLQPDIRILGSDWKGKSFTGCEIKNIKIVYHSRKHDYSTSNLRRRIYDAELVKQRSEKLTVDYM